MTFRYDFHLPSDQTEILLAWLSSLPFYAFEETETGISAYAGEDAGNTDLDEQLASLAQTLPFELTRTALEEQNWNALWESHFHPVRVGDFCGIRAEFHPPFEGVLHDLVIQPKMAFGTGHHETTYMMVRLMESLAFSGARVLDFGCGTGILGILAAQRGAAWVDAVDIEAAAVENTLENAQRNRVSSQLAVFLGDLHATPAPASYQIILANINRNVILDALPALQQKLDRGGTLLISGILLSDRDMVFNATATNGFQLISQEMRGDWLAARLERT
ncbi:MAG: 50S ribosomal protein L11 methyltransferase [Haliscomenobacter sp.]|nr:50S ribosomal protein L11 methyltransferase [Haliscomenobacter sp.]MBK8653834.1 50S ribosomal protein L11 methyltransferase [Haliscomenobacter sp.]MBP9077982.1 50S ribosomal protein L11 methyltransferase [Haliscomenobacter sp.]MBP9874471.1 50S ribosomal protein L11 methyltransferase [Haliscomenobacter sp.]